MTTVTAGNVATQVYRVFIKATPQAIWDALTSPEWTQKYGYGGRGEYELRPGGEYRHLAPAEMLAMGAPEVMVDGDVGQSPAVLSKSEGSSTGAAQGHA